MSVSVYRLCVSMHLNVGRRDNQKPMLLLLKVIRSIYLQRTYSCCTSLRAAAQAGRQIAAEAAQRRKMREAPKSDSPCSSSPVFGASKERVCKWSLRRLDIRLYSCTSKTRHKVYPHYPRFPYLEAFRLLVLRTNRHLPHHLSAARARPRRAASVSSASASPPAESCTPAAAKGNPDYSQRRSSECARKS